VSSAILGLVINSIALEFLNIPYVGWIIMVIFMVIGHTGNILLSGLGSLVHPMRLTFVEFYKNAGWTGGGKEYKPFIKKK
nr:V-type ATP synthase subunit I [Candidatus Delongbacteria bacterium]